MVVTAIRADARAAGCLIVEVDGGRVASLPVEIVSELGLAAGLELAPARYEALHAAAQAEGARRVALRMLAVCPRSTADLTRKLRDRGHEPAAVTAALERLEAAGLLDDAEFARHFVRVRGPKGQGPSRLVHDLLTRGVDRLVAERAVAEVSSAEGFDTEAQARALAARRATQLRSLPRDAQRRRLLGYLARRGFRGRAVREMVEAMLESGG